MSQSLYHNPFMPTRYLNPRASGLMVFGGGGGGGTVYTDVNGGQHATEALAIASNTAIATANAKAKKVADEKIAKEAEAKKVAEAANTKLIADYTAALNAAISGVNTDSSDEIGSLGLKVQAVNSVAMPGAATDVEETGKKLNAILQGKLGPLQASLKTAQEKRSSDLASGARKQTEKAMTDPSSLVVKGDVNKIDPNAAGTTIEKDTGSVGTSATVDPTKITETATATTPKDITAETVVTETSADKVTSALEGKDAVTGEVSAESVVTGATKDPSTSEVMNLKTVDGTATVMDTPAKREIKAGEIITGVADAERASTYTEEIQAATATPSDKATVKGQLTELMQDFEGGETPPWASGALRNATAQMAQRGLGASSMAGQALVQAAMEAALPIALQDAQTFAGFEMTNLSNRQQRAMLAAQQRAAFIGQEFDQAFQARVQNSARIADVANMNFTADQSIALENSRNANTMNLANLSNKQSLIMAQAAAISQLDMANLSNEQQAAVQNAQSFLAMDMANLSNRQQTEMFKSQSIIQSILTDTAATNAAKQFNASSENQTKQFMANMKTQVEQFNATQTNTTNQFNAGSENAAKTFNAQVENQRNQFNAQNALVIAQANAQWRQNTATINTAAQNEANMQAAQTANAFTQSTLDQIWQRERDIMDYAFKGSESSKDRALDLVLADKKYSEYAKVREDNETTDMWAVLTKTFGL
jgi:hypothetical protein